MEYAELAATKGVLKVFCEELQVAVLARSPFPAKSFPVPRYPKAPFTHNESGCLTMASLSDLTIPKVHISTFIELDLPSSLSSHCKRSTRQSTAHTLQDLIQIFLTKYDSFSVFASK